ncbi:18682_t:CDS:2, partial [Funneliformis geosporum]
MVRLKGIGHSFFSKFFSCFDWFFTFLADTSTYFSPPLKGQRGELIVILDKSEKTINSVDEIENSLDDIFKFINGKEDEYYKKVITLGIKSLFESREISYWDKTVYFIYGVNSVGESAGVALLLAFYSAFFEVGIPSKLSATDSLILPQENYEEVQKISKAYYKRFPNDSRKQGTVFFFLRVLISIFKKTDYQKLLVTFDGGGTNFRKNLLPQYKAQREAMPEELYQQMETVKLLLEKTGLTYLQLENQEADDLIASFVNQKTKDNPGLTFDIFTRDKDLLQLLSQN